DFVIQRTGFPIKGNQKDHGAEGLRSECRFSKAEGSADRAAKQTEPAAGAAGQVRERRELHGISRF
ncbi:hypothetical protein LI108_13595, partial [Streptococcus gordonii]